MRMIGRKKGTHETRAVKGKVSRGKGKESRTGSYDVDERRAEKMREETEEKKMDEEKREEKGRWGERR